jgi:hypothetical protein
MSTTPKNKANIKQYFQQVLLPLFNRLYQTTELLPIAENVIRATAIQLHYEKQNNTEIFKFTSLESLETTLELYSKNEADCITICVFALTLRLPTTAVEMPSITIYCKFHTQKVVISDMYGHVIDFPYHITEANDTAVFYLQQFISKYISDLKTVNN